MVTNDCENVLRYLIDNGMVNLDDVQEEMNKKQKEEIIKNHPYKIWQGKDLRWRTRVSDPASKQGRRMIVKSKKETLYNAICDHYENADKQKRNAAVTLSDLYPDWLEYKKLHTDASTYITRIDTDWKRYYVGTEIADKPIKEITKLFLDEWAHRIIKENKMTRKKYTNVQIIVRQGLDYAVDLGLIDQNPMHSVKIDKKIFSKCKKKDDFTQIYSKKELSEIGRMIWEDFRNEVKVYVLSPLALGFEIQTGMRIGEICAAKHEDIEGDHIHVQRMYRRDSREIIDHTKTDNGDRSIYLTTEARRILAAIEEYKLAHGIPLTGFLFSVTDRPITERCINDLLKKYCKYMGVLYRSSHSTRKSYGSALIGAGVNINTVRKLLGHADEQTTLKYYCYDQELDAEKTSKIEEALM